MTKLMLGVVALLAGSAAAQTISYTGGLYSQNFDGLASTGSVALTGVGPHHLDGVLGSTGMTGWYAMKAQGSGADTEFRAQDGSLSGSAGRGVVSFGTASSSERALGGLATSAQIGRFGGVMVNNTSGTLTDVTISFTGEQWRRGNVPSPGNSLYFLYGITNSISSVTTQFASLNFAAPNNQASPTEVALDGNLAANQTFVSATITGLSWAPGQSFAFAWQCEDISGQDDGLAIDSLTVSAVPAPGSAALLAVGGLVAARRRR